MKAENAGLSGNTLKLIAAASMLCDHVGMMFFPHISLFRIIGRIAYPIFAFMIAEGTRYTRSPLRYFLQLFGLAVLCQVVYYLADRSLYMSILVTFSCSSVMLFALRKLKEDLFAPEGAKFGGALLFTASVLLVYWLNQKFTIDYGFLGCMVPVFAGLLHSTPNAPKWLKDLDKPSNCVLVMGIGLLLLALEMGGTQPYSLLTLCLLLLYSGKRGKRKMKYFFYIFYPLHLAALQGLAWLIY